MASITASIRSLARRAAPWVLGALAASAVLSSRMRRAVADETPDDGVPRGAVAYFATGMSCPTGWAPASNVEGRFVVGVTEPTAVGRAVGAPLANREQRTHTHAFSGTVTLGSRSIAGANGSNNQGARAGEYTIAGNTAAAAANMGFVQLRACVKQ
jgi:hypothetical protein